MNSFYPFLHSHSYNKVIKEALISKKIQVIFSPKQKITSTPFNFKVVLSPYDFSIFDHRKLLHIGLKTNAPLASHSFFFHFKLRTKIFGEKSHLENTLNFGTASQLQNNNSF
jgi:hypothetical protein